MLTPSTRSLAALSLASACLVTACEAPPPGNTGGRIDPYRSTPADQFDRSVSAVTLLDFADVMSQQLAYELPAVLAERGHATKVVLEMGGIENTTATPTNDFRTIRRRIFLRLRDSAALRAQADVVEAVERMDAQYQRLAPQTPQVATTSARYDPNITYVLEGSFGELSRGGGAASTYSFDVTITHLPTRQIVFSKLYDSKQIR
ncbi:MAG: hypothetical protein AAGI30_08435 [Planctomycetota bacterium]